LIGITSLASPIAIITLAAILARWAAQLWLERLNLRYVQAHADVVPEAFRDSVDAGAYARSIEYTLAKGRFSQVEMTFEVLLLLAVLFSGVLPWGFHWALQRLGSSAVAMALFLMCCGVVLGLPRLPLDWYEQFKLEGRFGFNTTTPKVWWLDRCKSLLLSLALGGPLLVLILKLVEWAGPGWWVWAWAALLGFQCLMLVLAPVLILPLFNKFTPLPEGTLRERLLALARRTEFRAQSVQVMDGSKRSRHSNAFFTGFGRFRKIVLFDTLIEHLSEPELEAVLAHEIAHYKKKHIPKMLLGSAAGSLVAFYGVALLSRQDEFYRAFGFEPGSIVPALLLFALLSGVVTFWLSPLFHLVSRRFEYQADRYAAVTLGQPAPLVGALRKLSEKNLSNLTPHPFYSGFYYSHPTLLEREEALREVGAS
jgi:STE24 endopeptidase